MCPWLRDRQEDPTGTVLSLGVEQLEKWFRARSRAVQLCIQDSIDPPQVSVPMSYCAQTEVCTREELVGPFLPPLPQARDARVRAGAGAGAGCWLLGS